MGEWTFLLISVVINLVLMVALILSERGKSKDLRRYLENLERAFGDEEQYALKADKNTLKKNLGSYRSYSKITYGK